jgi:hypothetical protein
MPGQNGLGGWGGQAPNGGEEDLHFPPSQKIEILRDLGSATFSSLLCKIHSENEIATQQKSSCSLIQGLN